MKPLSSILSTALMLLLVSTSHAAPGLGDDSDGDGLSNLLEFALNLNPMQPDPYPGVIAANTLTFTKGSNTAADTGTTYQMEASTDDLNWSTVVTQIAGDGTPAISYTLPSGSSPRYVRLKVSSYGTVSFTVAILLGGNAQVPAIALALGSNPASVRSGDLMTVNLLIGNTASVGSSPFNYTLRGVTGSGTRAAGDSGAVAPITGTYTAVLGVNSFNITASVPAASNSPQSVAFSQTAYGLAAAATSQTVEVGVNGSGLGTTGLPALDKTVTVSGKVFNGTGEWTQTTGSRPADVIHLC